MKTVKVQESNGPSVSPSLVKILADMVEGALRKPKDGVQSRSESKSAGGA